MSPFLRQRPPGLDPMAGLSLHGATVVAVQIGGEVIRFTDDVHTRDVAALAYLNRKRTFSHRLTRVIKGA